jgi:hypothetical protein
MSYKFNILKKTLYLLIFFTNNSSAEVFFNFESKLKYDNNVTNAQLRSDIVKDYSVSLSADGGYYLQLDDFDSLIINGEVSGESFNAFHGLDNITLGAKAMLKRKWGLGLYQPWSAVSFSSTRLTFNNDLRDGWLYKAQIGLGKRITERWDIGLNLALEKRTADNSPAADPGVSGAVFNLSNKILEINSQYAFNNNYFLSLGYQISDGDVVSITKEESPTGAFDPVTTAVAMDNIFGPNAEAYRINGVNQTFKARISKELSTNTSVALEYQRQIVNGDGNINYYKSLPAITLFYGF